jgi:hypothetical protein
MRLCLTHAIYYATVIVETTLVNNCSELDIRGITMILDIRGITMIHFYVLTYDVGVWPCVYE